MPLYADIFKKLLRELFLTSTLCIFLHLGFRSVFPGPNSAGKYRGGLDKYQPSKAIPTLPHNSVSSKWSGFQDILSENVWEAIIVPVFYMGGCLCV